MDNLDQINMLLSAACDLQGDSLTARETARDKFRDEESNEENILRILIDGLLAHLAKDLGEIIHETNEHISYQIGLSNSFIRTHFLVMDCVLNGDLIEAIVLCRKQLESLARMHEVDSKPLAKLFKKTPNISNVLKGESGRMYGAMSEVAHFSTPRVAELLHVIEKGQMIGPSLHPRYSERSHACSDMEHFVAVHFAFWFIEKLDDWYPANDYTEEKHLLTQAFSLALKCGVLRIADDD